MKLSSRHVGFTLVLPLLALGIACSATEATSPNDAGAGADGSINTDSAAPDPRDGGSSQDAAPPQDAANDARITVDAGPRDSGKPDAAKTVGEVNAEAYCGARCAFVARCAKTESACSNQGAPCVANATGFAASWRDEYVDAFKTCYPALACTSATDTCIEQGFAVADPQFPNSTYIQDCLAKRTACANAFADDLCLSLAALNDTSRGKADACKSQACGQVPACLRAAGAFTY